MEHARKHGRHHEACHPDCSGAVLNRTAGCPGGASSHGVFGYRVIGRYLVLVNGVGVPKDDAALPDLLGKIGSRFQSD